MRTRLALLLAAATFATGLGVAPAARAADPDDMAAMIATAKTKADHEKIAADFEEQAKEARAESEKHKKMAEAYAKSGNPAIAAKHGLVQHCNILAKAYAEAAERDAMLAKAHRDMAAQAK